MFIWRQNVLTHILCCFIVGASFSRLTAEPAHISGIYPHLAVSNNRGASESGIGAVMVWNNQLWYMTYVAHGPKGSTDELYSADSNFNLTVHTSHPGGTPANRYIHQSSNQLIMGASFMDVNGNVSPANVNNLVGRLTGTMPHLTDPNKLYFMTMEEGFYEVNVNTLAVTELRRDRNQGGLSAGTDLPGSHGKGFYVAHDHVFYGQNGSGGGLFEWNGTGNPALAASWTLIDRNKYNEITSRNGVSPQSPGTTDPVWALGWDHKSVLLNIRDHDSGQWTRVRLPKGSYTHDADNGWFTEWPRIRDVGLGAGKLLANEHGLIYEFSENVSSQNLAGITPFSNHLKMIVDYTEWNGGIAMAANDVSHFDNPLAGWAHSNLVFVEKNNLKQYGQTAQGFGGPLVRDNLRAGRPSEAFLINGFRHRTLHLTHNLNEQVDFTIEIDPQGQGNWTTYRTIGVEADDYGYHILPAGLSASWIRVKANKNVSQATAFFHLSNQKRIQDNALTQSLAPVEASGARSYGVIRTVNNSSFPLEFAADIVGANGQITGRAYYRASLNSDNQLVINPVADASAEQALRRDAATTKDFGVDAASAYIDQNGVRYRLPKGDAAFDSVTASGWRRGVREVVTERALMNIHGTFYELPRNSSGGVTKIQPVTTHNLDIFDFSSWRGMLVLSGNLSDAIEDDHYIRSEDGKAGLWFGNVDDLYRFGAPQGQGGPWKNTLVRSDEPSDPFLMYGYSHKQLELSHDAEHAVEFTVQVDFLADGTWRDYASFKVAPGEILNHVFPESYSAYWVRVVSDADVSATAWFIYDGSVPEPVSAVLMMGTGALLGLQRYR